MPAEAIVALITTLAQIYLELLRSLPEAQKIDASIMVFEDVTAWRAFFKTGKNPFQA